MNAPERRLTFRLRLSGALIIAGLAVEAASLVGIHPLAFLAFMFIGGGFLVAGVATYLLFVVAFAPSSASSNKENS